MHVPTPTPKRVYGWHQGTGGVFHYRIGEPLRGLALRGFDTATGPILTDAIVDSYDVIVTSLLHDPHNSSGWQKLATKSRRPIMVMDVDDFVWRFDSHTASRNYWTPTRLAHLESNIACADVVTTPSAQLAEKLRATHPNVHIIGNYVPEWLLRHRPFLRQGRTVFGFQGGRQHTSDLRMIDSAVQTTLTVYPGTRVHLWGELNPVGWPPGQVIRTPWQTDMTAYYKSLVMNVGLAPLAKTVFNAHKSALRLVEYAALGIPAIASRFGPYDATMIDNGSTGWLTDSDGWRDIMGWCVRHPDQVRTMGLRAHQKAKTWTTEANVHRWVAAYEIAA